MSFCLSVCIYHSVHHTCFWKPYIQQSIHYTDILIKYEIFSIKKLFKFVFVFFFIPSISLLWTIRTCSSEQCSWTNELLASGFIKCIFDKSKKLYYSASEATATKVTTILEWAQDAGMATGKSRYMVLHCTLQWSVLISYLYFRKLIKPI